MSSPEWSPGDIVLIVHIPLDDPSVAKPRPAIVVSGSAFNKGNLDVIIAPISSVIRYGDPRQVIIQDDDPDFCRTGLKMASAVKCGAVFSYPKSMIRRRLGKAPEAITGQVRELLVKFLTDD